MKDVQLLVLNDHMQMAGIGELAELFVRSPHMRSGQGVTVVFCPSLTCRVCSAGYLGLQDKTDEKFLVNPVRTRACLLVFLVPLAYADARSLPTSQLIGSTAPAI
jgi:hypothetical protein